MDYGRKIAKQKSETWSEKKIQDKIPLRPCASRKQDPPPEEDRRLVNWKKWLADREQRQKHLTAALKKEPLELALNSHEKVRIQNETKCILEAAVREEVTNQDKYRGNPAFWKVPHRLKECGDEDDNEDDVVATLDRSARNLPPDVTRVGLADFIKREKKLIQSCTNSANINLNSKWDCSNYVRQRTTELEREIKFLEPKKPEMNNLIVIGRKIESEWGKKKFIRPPVITISTPETKEQPLNDPDDRAALRIQDREFVLEKNRHFEKLSKEQTLNLQASGEGTDRKKYAYAVFESDRLYKVLSKKSKPITWSLNFVSKNKEIIEQTFTLENRGIYVIHIDWRDASPKFQAISTLETPKHFFFNKNRIKILPGQKVEMPVWFRSDLPIVAMETWQLLIQPKVYPGTLYLRLWATSRGEKYKLRMMTHIEDVREYLKSRVRDSVIREIIDELILESTNEREVNEIPYDMFFLEAEIFQSRNPEHSYNSILIDELKDIYNEATNEEAADWNLSLLDLRSVLMSVEDFKCRRLLMKQFQDICNQCLRPIVTYSRLETPKEKLVYWMLCSFFNQFEDESHFVMEKCCQQMFDDDLGEDENDHDEAESQSEILVDAENSELYRDIFRVRIRCLLQDTIDRICSVVECHNYLNKDFD